LTIDEAAARIRRSKKWLYRHRESLPFVRKLGPRSYVVSKQKLESWLAKRPC
jgi:Helix-turn-helix domain